MILGARFSNFEAWVAQPTKPTGGLGITSAAPGSWESRPRTVAGIRITSGVFQVWRSAGLTTNAELFSGAIGLLVLSAVFLGGFNHHTGGGHLYRTQYALGTTFNELLVAHGSIGLTAWHAQLAINLAVVGSASIATAHLRSYCLIGARLLR